LIGSLVIGVWVLLGLLNIWIWRDEVREEAEESEAIFNPDFVKKWTYTIMMVVSPYYFVRGIKKMIADYILIRSFKKIMTDVWLKEGKNPKEEWKKMKAEVKKDKDETTDTTD
jgi:hypothetical protein